jgi:hypothetical protein
LSNQDRERQRAAERRWYHANKAKVLEKKRRKKDRLRALVRERKARPCADCGVSYPYYVMDFDHVTEDKVMIISKLVLRGATNLLMVELEKCEVVCSNCHRIRTHERLLARMAGDAVATGQLSLFDGPGQQC